MSVERVSHLVDIYIDHKMSPEEDAGWHGESMLSRLIEYKGDLPAPTGNDQSDLKMINEIRYIRNDHYELPHAKRLLDSLAEKYRQALIADRYMNKKTFMVNGEEIRHNKYSISIILGITPDCYKSRLKKGRALIIEKESVSCAA